MKYRFLAVLLLSVVGFAHAQDAIPIAPAKSDRVKMTIYIYRPMASDLSLRGTLERWAGIAGLKFEWFAPDYPLTRRALDLPPVTNLGDGLKGLAQIYSKVTVPISVSISNGTVLVSEAKNTKDSVTDDIAPATSKPSKTETASDKPFDVTTSAPKASTEDSHWRIKKGELISAAFKTWCKEDTGYELSWEATQIVSSVDVDLTGPFETAVSTVIEAIDTASANAALRSGDISTRANQVKIRATFFRANNPKILSVEDM